MNHPSARGAALVVIVLVAIAQAYAIKPPREQAPAFRATSMDGEKFSNASLKGKIVLLQFWATWCKYCRADQPVVDEIAREFAGRGLIVLAVDVNESKKTVKKYLEQSPRGPKIILTEDTNLAAFFEAKTYPLYVLLDRDGMIAGTQKGAGGGDALRSLLRKVDLE
ncbi:MAG TPA: TlpA disulfide reductase family protein [Bryobacteraceae bacterium]